MSFPVAGSNRNSVLLPEPALKSRLPIMPTVSSAFSTALLKMEKAAHVYFSASFVLYFSVMDDESAKTTAVAAVSTTMRVAPSLVIVICAGACRFLSLPTSAPLETSNLITSPEPVEDM